MSIRVVEDGASLQDILSRFPDDVCVLRSHVSSAQLARIDAEKVEKQKQRWARRLLAAEAVIFLGVASHIYHIFTTDEHGNTLATAAQIKEAKGDRIFHIFEAEIAKLRIDYENLTDEIFSIDFSDDMLDEQIQKYNRRVDCLLRNIQEYKATIKNGGPRKHAPLICPRKIPYTPTPPKPLHEEYGHDLLAISAQPYSLETA